MPQASSPARHSADHRTPAHRPGTAAAPAPPAGPRLARRACSRTVRASGAQSAKPASGSAASSSPPPPAPPPRSTSSDAAPGAVSAARSPLDQPGIHPPGREVLLSHQPRQEPEVRRAARHPARLEPPRQPRQRDRPRRAVRNQLGDHRIVPGRDCIPRPHPRTPPAAPAESRLPSAGPSLAGTPRAGSSA